MRKHKEPTPDKIQKEWRALEKRMSERARKAYISLLNVSDFLDDTIEKLAKDRRAIIRYIAAIVKKEKANEARQQKRTSLKRG